VTGSSDSYDHLLRELAEERVAALNRIARHLEQRIHALHELRVSIRQTAGDARDAREELLERYRQVRIEALRYRWYLDVQREALGLRPHETVEQYYGVPGPLEG
jgi:hypothetical protein